MFNLKKLIPSLLALLLVVILIVMKASYGRSFGFGLFEGLHTISSTEIKSLAPPTLHPPATHIHSPAAGPDAMSHLNQVHSDLHSNVSQMHSDLHAQGQGPGPMIPLEKPPTPPMTMTKPQHKSGAPININVSCNNGKGGKHNKGKKCQKCMKEKCTCGDHSMHPLPHAQDNSCHAPFPLTRSW